MSKSKSPRGRGKKIQQSDKINEDNNESSQDEAYSPQRINRSRTSTNDSYLNVSSRSDLSHHSDANVSNNSGTYKIYPRLNTSSSSDNDGPDGAAGLKAPKSPSSLYPLLSECKNDGVVMESSESKEHFEDRSSKVHPKQHKALDMYTILLPIIGFFIILVAFYFWPGQNSEKQLDNSTVPTFDIFVSDVNNLEEALPSQNKRLWRTVKASAKHVLQDTTSTYPVVILMAATTDRTHISRCIASQIASRFESTHRLNPQITDIRDLENFDPARQKKVLDEKLNSAFSSGHRKSFIIDNLQLLHPEAALLLHGYCDGDNAPHKDVMMVLLLNIDEKDVIDYNNAAIENYLEQLWSRSLEVDKVKALLSRVANNIVTIETEENVAFKKACE